MTPSDRSALVLAAGLGTRLWPLTCVRAKAAAPVAGRPLVSRVLDTLARWRVASAVVNLHHLPHTITGIVGDGSEWGLPVRYSWEPTVLGSGGGPRHALPLLDSDPFFIVNADTLTDVDLAGLLEAHERTGALVTLAVVPNTMPDHYSGLLAGDDHSVVGFTRKGDHTPSHHFIGVQVAARSVFAHLPDGEPAESVTGVYRELMTARPGSVRVWPSPASFDDIGTPRDYVETSFRLAAAEGPDSLRGAGGDIAASARVSRTILWDRVQIGADAVLEECVLTDDVRIPAGLRLSGSVVVRADRCEDRAGVERVGDLAIVRLTRDAGRRPTPEPGRRVL